MFKKLLTIFVVLILSGQIIAQDAFLGAFVGGSSSTVEGQNYVSNPARGLYLLAGLNFTIVHKRGFFYGLEAGYEQKGFSNTEPTLIDDIVYEGDKRWNFDHLGGSLKMGYVHAYKKHRFFGNLLGTYNYLLTTNIEVLTLDNLGNLREISIENEQNTKSFDILLGFGGGYATRLADRMSGSIELRWTGSVIDHFEDPQELRQGYHTAIQLLIGVKIPLEARNACDLCP